MELTCNRDEGTISVSVHGRDNRVMVTNLAKDRDLFFIAFEILAGGTDMRQG